MKTLLNPFFLGSFILASINQLVEYAGVFIPFVHSYLDDLLCFPIVLTFGLAAYRIFIPNYILTKWHIWPLVIVFTIIFEIYLPTTSSKYTADILDPIAYAIGALAFSKFVNK